jgi:ATP/maltotriose-dependent transcriptional regulator MalT
LLRCLPPRPDEAAQVLDAALPELRDLGSPIDLAVWESVRALADLLLGRPRSAERLAREALLHLSTHPGTESATALTTLGDALVAQGKRDEARGHYLAAYHVLMALPQSRRTAAALREVGLRLELLGDSGHALLSYRMSLDAAGVLASHTAVQAAFGTRELLNLREEDEILTPSAFRKESAIPAESDEAAELQPGQVEAGRVWRTGDDRSHDRQDDVRETSRGS